MFKDFDNPEYLKSIIELLERSLGCTLVLGVIASAALVEELWLLANISALIKFALFRLKRSQTEAEI